jgi:Tol biopolymer transport system component
MWGVVRDVGTGQPIASAQITVHGSSGETLTTSTGDNGLYSFDLTQGQQIPTKGVANVQVSAPGYETTNETRDIQYDDPPENFWETQSFQLQPKELGKLAFIDDQGNAWIVNPNGSGKTAVTSGTGNNYGFDPPVWSPSGNELAIYVYDSGEDYQWWAFDLTGKKLAKIGETDNQTGGEAGSPEGVAWSPDGTSVIYGRYDDGIYETNIKTGKTREILTTTDYTYDHNPAWSPDGKKLVFVHHEFGNDFYVSLINFDERKVPYTGEDRYENVFNPDFTLLASGNSEHDQPFRFQWTPDSRKIAFCVGDPTDSVATIDVIDTVTGTTDKIQPEGFDKFEGCSRMTLSNDGQQLVFSDDIGNLFVVSVDGSNMREIHNRDSKDPELSGYNPQWSPDDSQVAFYDSAGTGIYTINADGTGLRNIPNTEGAKMIAWTKTP